MSAQPLAIAVAPNGARLTRSLHSSVPILEEEIVATAESCLESGAAMIHLHVRDLEGKHTILPEFYAPVLEALDKKLGDKLVVQVTSEAAGVYTTQEQIRCVRELKPQAVSMAIRELAPTRESEAEAAKLFSDLDSWGCMSQYILYDKSDLRRYSDLIDRGVISRKRNFVLYVCGKYSGQAGLVEEIDQFVGADQTGSLPMYCAFGPLNPALVSAATEYGLHARVGFENNTQLATGETAQTNAEVVRAVAAMLQNSNRTLADAEWLRDAWARLVSD